MTWVCMDSMILYRGQLPAECRGWLETKIKWLQRFATLPRTVPSIVSQRLDVE